ncbi:hypothetical protein KJ673_04100, partial [Patescibacteria group bacterium]|nr:hypothetical protein [Patescibacteria group bacterium]
EPFGWIKSNTFIRHAIPWRVNLFKDPQPSSTVPATGTSEVEMSESAVTLGDLVSIFYEEYLALYGDEELAAQAAAATINELIQSAPRDADLADADG